MVLVVAPTGQWPVVAGVLFAIAFYPIFGLVPAYVAKTAKAATATIIFGVANVTLGIGGMTGNYLAGVLKNLTGTFMWIYVAVAVSAVVLAILSIILPHEGQDLDVRESNPGRNSKSSFRGNPAVATYRKCD
jgi:MFS family permease